MFYCTCGYSGRISFCCPFSSSSSLSLLKILIRLGSINCRWSFLNPLLATSSFLFGTTLGTGHSPFYCRDVCDSPTSFLPPLSLHSPIYLKHLSALPLHSEHIYQGLQMVRLIPLLVNSVKNRIPSLLF